MVKAVSRGQALQVAARVATQVNWDKLDGKNLQEKVLDLSAEEFSRRFTDFLGGYGATQIVSREKFSLLCDLGTITVPADYDHATRLTSFRKKNRKKFYYYNDDITDEHFPAPSRILKPGEKLQVKVFKQCVSGGTTSEERMTFLKSQNAVFPGAQGLALVFDQKSKDLPKGKFYTSFDEKDRLWKDADGDHRVPYVYAYSVGGFRWRLGHFEGVWNQIHAVLCFCDLEFEPSSA